MKKNILLLIGMLVISGCQTAPATVNPVEVQSIALILANTMVAQTQAAWSTPTTATTPTTAATVTPANTPTATIPPPPTVSPLFAPKQDGFYLINVDIAPGVWRSTGTGDSCYWKVSTNTGDIMDNHFGMAGGTAYIPANGFEFQIQSCGTLEYLSPP